MPSIGELFVTLGAKTDASMAQGLRKLQELGSVAQRVTTQMGASARMTSQMWGAVTRELSGANSGMKSLGATSRATVNEIKNVSKAMRTASMDAKMMASSASSLIQRNLGAVRAQAEAARVAGLARGGGGRSGINWGAVGDPFNPSGQKQDIRNHALFNNIRKGRTAGNAALEEFWATVSGAPDPDHHPLLAPGRRRGSLGGTFKVGGGGGGNVDWASATGDPFAPGGGGTPPKRPTRTPGTPGRPGRPGFNRFGPLGDVASFRRMLLGAGIYQAVTGIGELSDTYTRLQMRIAQVTTTQEQADSTFNRLRGIARNTKADLESTAEGYVRIKNATAEMKLSEEDTFKFVERLNMALGTSGATASEARSGMMQLTQALAKGKLDGDEFRSLAENMPNILKILGKELNKTEGQLRAMSESGELTRDKIVKAFLATKDLKAPPDTFASTWTAFKNDMLVLIGTLMKDGKVLKAFKDILEAMAEIFKVLAPIIASVIVHVAEFIKALSDGEPLAIALAVALGTMLIPQIMAMVFWFGRLAALPFTMIFGQLARFKALAAGNFRGAAGLGAAGTTAAGAAPATGSGTKAGLGGLAAAAGPIGMGLVAMDMVNPEGGPSKYFGALGAAYEFIRGGGSKQGTMGDAIRGGFSGTNVTVGPTTVNIYANDMDDAKEKFSQDAMDRMMRHAAGAVNRSGS